MNFNKSISPCPSTNMPILSVLTHIAPRAGVSIETRPKLEETSPSLFFRPSPHSCDTSAGDDSSPTTTNHDLGLRFRDIPPLEAITLQRGRSRFRVHPYSVQHAFLTGHTGTPTRQRGRPTTLLHTSGLGEGKSSTGEAFLSPRCALKLIGIILGTGGSEGVTSTPTFKAPPRLLYSPGDAPQTKRLASLRSPTPHHSGHDTNSASSQDLVKVEDDQVSNESEGGGEKVEPFLGIAGDGDDTGTHCCSTCGIAHVDG